VKGCFVLHSCGQCVVSVMVESTGPSLPGSKNTNTKSTNNFMSKGVPWYTQFYI